MAYSKSIAGSIPGAIASQDGSQDGSPLSEAELLAALQTASDNVMRLACKLHAQPDADAAHALAEEHALAQELIARLLALPAASAASTASAACAASQAQA